MTPDDRSLPARILTATLTEIRIAVRRALRTILVLAVLGVFLFIVQAVWGWAAAGLTGARALERWDALGRPIDQRFLDDFPARATNEDAAALAELVAPLGIQMEPGPARGIAVTSKARGAYPHNPIEEYPREVGGSMEDLPEQPSEALLDYCDARRSQLEAVAAFLQSADPLWALDPGSGPGAHVPGLAGAFQLQKTLLACATALDREGVSGAPDRLMEASWRLDRRLGERPELVSQVFRLAVLRLQAGAVRHLRSPDPAWADRLGHADPMETLARGMRGQARATRREALGMARYPWESTGTREPLREVVFRRVPGMRSWFRWALLHEVSTSAATVRAVEETGPCFSDSVLGEESDDAPRLGRSLADWIAQPRLSHPDLLWARGRRAAIELEAAGRVIAFKSAVASEAAPPRTPEDLESLVRRHGLETGSLCEDGRWVYGLDDGGWVVRFEGPEVPAVRWSMAEPLEQHIPWPPRHAQPPA